MKLEEIIRALDEYIMEKSNTKINLVLHKSIISNPTFKAYKQVNFDLWVIKNRKRKKVLSLSKPERILSGQEDHIMEILSIQFCKMLFEWIDSDEYKQLIKGEN